MIQQQKERIAECRATGASYGQIAKALGLSVNTVKSYVGTSRAQPYLEILAVLQDDKAIMNFAETISGSKPGSLAKAKAAIGSRLRVKVSSQRDMME